MRGILSKLPGINAELVQGHPERQSWNFTQLLNALREWKEIHPRENVKARDTLRSFHVEERNGNATRGCVYCREVSHKAKDCTAITSIEDRRNTCRRKSCASIVLVRIEQPIVGVEETARIASRGTTPQSETEIVNYQVRGQQ